MDQKSMRMKRLLLVLILVLIGYLGLSFLVGRHVEREYKLELSRRMVVLGKHGFIDTPRFSDDIKNNPKLNRYRTILWFTPPIGWIVARDLETLDDSFIFASKNMALPESQRFSDIEECRKFGFNPDEKSDVQIIKALVSKCSPGN